MTDDEAVRWLQRRRWWTLSRDEGTIVLGVFSAARAVSSRGVEVQVRGRGATIAQCIQSVQRQIRGDDE